MNVHVDVDQLLAPYALDAVSEAEAELVRVHVAGCDECTATLARLAAVTAALPLAVEQVAPPAALRSRLLAEVEGRPGPRVLQLPWHATRLGRRVSDMRLRELASQPRRWVPATAAAAVVAGLLTWNVNLQGQLAAPGRGATAVVTGTMAGAAGAGTVTYLASEHVAVVSLRSLRAPSAGRIYELWVIEGHAGPKPAGLFVPGADGSKVLLVPNDLKRGDTIAVSDEPEAGSQAPTTTPFLSGHV